MVCIGTRGIGAAHLVAASAIVAAIAAMLCSTPVFASKSPAPEVLIVGSSSVNGSLGILVEKELEDRGYTVARKGKSSSGFSRPDFFDWQKEVAKLGPLQGTKAVLVYMGVNDGQSIWLRPDERASKSKKDQWVYFNDTAAWEAKYKERITSFVQSLCDAGTERVVLVTPMDVVGQKLQRRLERVRELQAQGAEATTCGKAISASGDAADIATDKAKQKELRIEDGAHATMIGAKRIWNRMESKLVGVLPPPTKPQEP